MVWAESKKHTLIFLNFSKAICMSLWTLLGGCCWISLSLNLERESRKYTAVTLPYYLALYLFLSLSLHTLPSSTIEAIFAVCEDTFYSYFHFSESIVYPGKIPVWKVSGKSFNLKLDNNLFELRRFSIFVLCGRTDKEKNKKKQQELLKWRNTSKSYLSTYVCKSIKFYLIILSLILVIYFYISEQACLGQILVPLIIKCVLLD